MYPSISIVTPNYNGAKYLEETINSVLSQNYPNLEYIIIDGGSTDGSIEIIKKYEKHLSYWVSEPDKGLYHALQKGFERSTGEIMGWINSDDLLFPRSLFSVSELLNMKGVNWITGVPTQFDEEGKIIHVADLKRWSKYDFWMGNYKWIQQESTFWKRDLWIKSNSKINTNLRLAGDFDLWLNFFKHDKLYSIRCILGGFRIRSANQLSLEGIEEYYKEASYLLTNNKICKSDRKAMAWINLLNSLNKFFPPFLNKKIQAKIEIIKDYPRPIYFNRNSQKFTF